MEVESRLNQLVVASHQPKSIYVLDRVQYEPATHGSTVLADCDLIPEIEIDAEWPLASLRSQEIRFLGKLAPHGVGNPDVTLLSRKVPAVEASRVGEDGRHLRLRLKDGNVTWPAIAFDWTGETPGPGDCLDVVYSLSADRYGPAYEGAGGALQLTVEDLRISREAAIPVL